MRYIITITAAGDIEAVEIPAKIPMKMLKKIVGGEIETIQAKQGMLVVNRDHMINAMPLNSIASDMMHEVVFGDAVLCRHDGYRLEGFFLDRAERIIRGLKESVPA